MADAISSNTVLTANEPSGPGTWQTVEQAAVSLGLSVRTVNRHISAQKLNSRLMDGRREVFVPSSDPQQPAEPDNPGPPSQRTGTESHPSQSVADTFEPGSPHDRHTVPQDQQGAKVAPDSFLDLETALAMADRKADRKVELAVSAYQSLTRSIETQAHAARRMAGVAWCVVGVLTLGVTVTLVWTATRVTRAESDSQHLKQQADESDRRVAEGQQKLADMQEKLSAAQEHAANAEGQVVGYEKMQSRQAASRPSSRPSLIDRLSTAFGAGNGP